VTDINNSYSRSGSVKTHQFTVNVQVGN